MKIVFLNPSAQRGGAETVLLQLLKALTSSRPEWSLHLITGESGPLLERARETGVTTECLPFPRILSRLGEASGHSLLRKLKLALAAPAAFFYVLGLRRRFSRLRPDLVHSNGMKMHFLSALAIPPGASSSKPNTAAASTIALVWHLHDYLSSRRAMAPLLRRMAYRCRVVVANSHSIAADARKVLPAKIKIHVVHNGVDTDLFTPEGPRLDLDKLANVPEAPSGTVRVGLVATFARWKGHDVFIRAAAMIPRDSSIRFYIIGGPIYATEGSQWSFDELRQIARDAEIEDRIAFTGFVDNVPAAMRALDVVVHASTKPEPFGMTIVEAMASGRAVISSGLGGASELIDPDTNALTFSPGDSAKLANGMLRLIDNVDLRFRLGAAARAKVEREFNDRAFAEKLMSIYQKS
jgi:glycosyltransferase involved in cell wall biosynthesis